MQGSWTLRPCPHGEVQRLVRELGLHEVTAAVLVRRGYGDPETARAFLAAEAPGHDPFLLGDMEQAVARIRLAVERGERICVHGDYDVDGICATALAVLTLRELGAEVDWHLPSRFDEGYGLSSGTIARLAGEGCGLVVTVDCGITAVKEVAEAKALGLDVVVTDHHRPGDELPDCPVVATRPSSYPFPELCGTGVVAKLAEALGVDVDAAPRPRRARDDRRRRPAPRREPRLRLRGPARARTDAKARPPRADALGARRPRRGRLRLGRLPARAADQRRRAGSGTPARRST